MGTGRYFGHDSPMAEFRGKHRNRTIRPPRTSTDYINLNNKYVYIYKNK